MISLCRYQEDGTWVRIYPVPFRRLWTGRLARSTGIAIENAALAVKNKYFDAFLKTDGTKQFHQFAPNP